MTTRGGEKERTTRERQKQRIRKKERKNEHTRQTVMENIQRTRGRKQTNNREQRYDIKDINAR